MADRSAALAMAEYKEKVEELETALYEVSSLPPGRPVFRARGGDVFFQEPREAVQKRLQGDLAKVKAEQLNRHAAT